jgi:hypothetical protein
VPHKPGTDAAGRYEALAKKVRAGMPLNPVEREMIAGALVTAAARIRGRPSDQVLTERLVVALEAQRLIDGAGNRPRRVKQAYLEIFKRWGKSRGYAESARANAVRDWIDRQFEGGETTIPDGVPQAVLTRLWPLKVVAKMYAVRPKKKSPKK